MRALLSPLTRLADSITGRTFLILSAGVTTAAVLSLALAIHTREREFAAMRQSEVVSRAQQVKTVWEAVSRGDEPRSALDAILGIRMLERTPPYAPDRRIETHLSAVLGPASSPRAGIVPVAACLPEAVSTDQLGNASNRNFATRIECWLVSFVASDGQRVNAAMFAPPFVSPVGSAISPVYLAVLLLASALMSLLVARLVIRPLRRLSDAAAAFSLSLDAPDTAVSGPSEVRAALATFNIMQSRVREGLLSRTQLLASVSHDLQTPLTRMRLRIEQVRDREIREKLVADIQVMQRLVREGLELARSHETQEPWSLVDIDSLVGSLAEDAVEVGAQVAVVSTCAMNIEIRPNALGRAFTNLLDNAVKYGGSAEVSCRSDQGAVVIEIRDQGPGLPDPDDPRLFEPFYRAEGKDVAKGHGVGLTIARAQAELTGATVRLRNHPQGGLIAEIRLERTA